MTEKVLYMRSLAVLFCIAALLSVFGCSTTEMEPLPPLPKVPEYTSVPHPQGFYLSDLDALFNQTLQFTDSELNSCDSKIKTLREKTSIQSEIDRGVRELVASEPVFYHWCFYYKISKLHDALNEIQSLKERQNQLISTYASVAPLARGFQAEYQDTRYLQWAVKDYRLLSQRVFYRALTLTPEASSQMVEATPSPYALWRKDPKQSGSVLEKYGIQSREEVSSGTPITSQSEPMKEDDFLAAPIDREPTSTDAESEAFTEFSDEDLDLGLDENFGSTETDPFFDEF